MKYNKKLIALAATGFFLFASCGFFTEVTEKSIVQDMRALSDLLPGIEAGLSLLEDTEAHSRAITPGDADPALTGKTPSQVYTEAGGSGATLFGPFNGYYTDGQIAYMTMTPDGSNYLIELEIYDTTVLDLDYSYEKYYVSDTTWTYFTDSGLGTPGFAELKTFYKDGTVATRTLLNDSNLGGDNYAAIEVPLDVLANISDYTYTASPSDPAAGSSLYSSKVSAVISEASTHNTVEFYTETSATERSGVIYIDYKGRGWGKQINTVTRFEADDSAGIKTVRALSTAKNYTSIVEIDITGLNGSSPQYTSVTKTWRKDVNSNLEDQRAKISEVSMTLQSDGSYAGTMSTDNSVSSYLRELLIRLKNGKLSTSFLRNVDRSLGVEAELDLNALDAIQLDTAKGTFTGSYLRGSLVGTFVYYNGRSFEVEIFNGGYSVNGVDGDFDFLGELYTD
jgi:hypothetical protein